MTKEAYQTGRVRHVPQDGSREFVSLLAWVCVDGSALPPALIYQETSGDLQDTSSIAPNISYVTEIRSSRPSRYAISHPL